MTIEIELTQGKVAIVDNEDSDLAWDYNWYAKQCQPERWYAARSDNTIRKGYTLFLHRVILERILNRPIAPGFECDFIDGDSLNCRRENIREATRAQNQANKRGKVSRKHNLPKGVHRNKKHFEARISTIENGKFKAHYIGVFDTPELAHAAYCEKAKELFGEFWSAG